MAHFAVQCDGIGLELVSLVADSVDDHLIGKVLGLPNRYRI